MARKLSTIARRNLYLLIAGAASLAANTLPAQSDTPSTESPKVIDNPFMNGQPQPAAQAQPQPQLTSSSTSQTVSEPQQKVHRRTIAYQNPFAAASKAPPVDTSLRPGPISRWRHPVIPSVEPSGIKTALLSAPAGGPIHPKWDQLPPAEDLRSHAALQGPDTDPTFYARFATPSNPIATPPEAPSAVQFTPQPLTQPTWLTEFDPDSTHELKPIRVDTAVFDKPANAPSFASQTSAQSPGAHVERSEKVNRAFAIDSIEASPAKADVLPALISTGDQTAAAWLEQAQHAAKDASSPEELSSIVEFCDRGLRSAPDEKMMSSLRRLSAWAHNRRGELLADADRADEALGDFQAAISLDPSCSLAVHNRAVTFAQQNKFEAALRDFNQVIELNPGLAIAYRNRAELLAALGRMQQALSDYNQALEHLPNDPQLYRDRAYAYQQLGQLDNSMADFNRAIELAPDDPDTITQRGNLAAEQGKYDRAVADFQKAVSKDPNWAEAHRSMAWLAATCPNPKFQDPTKAVASAERAAKLAPADDYLVLDTLAAAHASAGHFDQAGDLQQRALSCAPPEIAASLKHRLDLYQAGKPFRNGGAARGDHKVASDTDAESSLPVGALR